MGAPESETFPFNLVRFQESVSSDPQKTQPIFGDQRKLTTVHVAVYRNVPKNLFQNVGKCPEKTISKVIWVAKGMLDVILSQINKKIEDQFHFQ